MMSQCARKGYQRRVDLEQLQNESKALIQQVQQNPEFGKFMEKDMGGIGQIINLAGNIGGNSSSDSPNLASFAMNAMDMLNSGGGGGIGDLAGLMGGMATETPDTNGAILQQLLSSMQPPAVTTTTTTTTTVRVPSKENETFVQATALD